MRDRRPDRIAALTDVIANSQLDGLLLSSPANIRYLTGFSGSSALVFVTARREVLFITDFRYKTQVADEVGDLARVMIEPQSLWTGLWQALPNYGYVEVASARILTKSRASPMPHRLPRARSLARCLGCGSA
jgi:Xaa-Pro aminopeptidase